MNRVDATEIVTFTSSKGIDGVVVHEDVTFNIDPHAYALSFVTRMRMSGTVEVEASPWMSASKTEYLDWAYTGTWSAVDDEPYTLILVAEFTEQKEGA